MAGYRQIPSPDPKTIQVRDGKSEIPRGKIVIGCTSSWFDGQGDDGTYPIGVSLGGGMVAHNMGPGPRKGTLKEVFGSWFGYRRPFGRVVYGDFIGYTGRAPDTVPAQGQGPSKAHNPRSAADLKRVNHAAAAIAGGGCLTLLAVTGCAIVGMGAVLGAMQEPVAEVAPVAVVEQAASPTPARTPTASPMPSPVPTSTPTAVPQLGGSYSSRTIIFLDPAGHGVWVGLPGEILLLVRIGSIAVEGPPPWVNVAGELREDGSFTATGTGTVAGFPGIQVEFTGSLTADGLAGEYTMGVGGGLPTDQSITYRIEG